MIRNMKPPRNLKGSCNILGDLGCDLGPIVRLEGRRHSKHREDFSENKASHSRGSFVSSWESFNPSRKCIYEDWRKFNPFTGGMWVKSSCQSCAGKCPRIWWVGKGGGENVRIRICLLANGTSLGEII